MADTIWKFTLFPETTRASEAAMNTAIRNDGEGDYFELPLSEQAQPLTVQTQRQRDGRVLVCLWVRTPSDAILPDHPTPNRRFYICGTGHKLHPLAGKHLGTFQLHDGALVFHVFEDKSSSE